jgi:thiamine pyrophosphokinase
MACYIFGAGEMTPLRSRPQDGDYVIAADGGWNACSSEGIVPDLLLGDFDSLDTVPDFHTVERVPVEKDDTDMMLAVKRGLALGHKEFHLYGGMGGRRTDHTVANLQALLYLAARDARGWLYGDGEVYTAIRNGSVVLSAQERGILSVFCLGGDAAGVTIRGAQYELENAVLTADFPLGVSNHFVGKDIEVSVGGGSLLLGLVDE